MKRRARNVLVGCAALALASPVAAHPTPDAHSHKPSPRDITEPVLEPYVRPPYEPKDEEDDRPEYLVLRKPGPYHHGGFFFRMAGGLGYGHDSAQSTDESFVSTETGESESFTAGTSGLAVATEVAVGFTPFASVVIGAAVDTATIPSPSSNDVSVSNAKYDYDISQLALFSLFVDVYPSAVSGLHFQGGFGVATLVMGQGFPSGPGADARAHTSVGPGFMLGIGHEWFVSPEWSLGLLGRFMYAWSDGTDPEDVGWEHKTYAPTLMVTATYH